MLRKIERGEGLHLLATWAVRRDKPASLEASLWNQVLVRLLAAEEARRRAHGLSFWNVPDIEILGVTFHLVCPYGTKLDLFKTIKR